MRLGRVFYLQDALTVAQLLIGKVLCRQFADGSVERYIISETEAYLRNGDMACHASKGVTKRNKIMFAEGGVVYVYLIYGMYWLLNIVTGAEGSGEAVLIRGVVGVNGSGRVGRELKLDATFYGESMMDSPRIWLETSGVVVEVGCAPRINIDYAGEPWISKPWRFMLKK